MKSIFRSQSHKQQSATTRCLSLLKKCKTMEHLKQALSLVFTVGLSSNTFALSRLLAFCSHPQSGNHSFASKIFRTIQNPTICLWNTMFKAFLVNDQIVQTLSLYREMLRVCTVSPDNYTVPYVFKACAKLQSSLHGESVHGQALKSGLELDIFVGNSLLAMYVKFRDMRAARKVFDEMPQLSLVSWTVMISGYGKVEEIEKAKLFFDLAPARDRGVWGAMISSYVQNCQFGKGLSLFRTMESTGIEIDEAVFVSALCACAHLGELDVGVRIHRRIERLNSSLTVRLGTGLIDMYAKCGDFDSATRVFREMPRRDTICWNAMISAMAVHGHGESALEFFREMEDLGVLPDDVTFVAVFTACSYTGMTMEGIRMLEKMCNVYKIKPKSEHYGCMVDLLGRAGLLEEATELIQRVSSEPSREELSWRAFLGACCKHERSDLAGFVSEKLLKSDFESGFYVLLSNLYAIAGKVGDADRVRSLMIERGVEKKVPGFSSVEIARTDHEFIAEKKIHRHVDRIHDVLESFKNNF